MRNGECVANQLSNVFMTPVNAWLIQRDCPLDAVHNIYDRFAYSLRAFEC